MGNAKYWHLRQQETEVKKIRNEMSRALIAMCVVLQFSGMTPIFAQPAATTSTEEFLALLSPVTALEGRFEQSQYSVDGILLAQSSGLFRLLRPGYFSWEIVAPDNQLIIADPTYLWHYDKDLETVTRRPVNNADTMSPLQVLGGNEAALRQHYTVENMGQGSFVLRPIDINPGFTHLMVTIQANKFTALEIEENLKQRVSIVFDQVNPDIPLTKEDFSFTPPADADLFYYDE